METVDYANLSTKKKKAKTAYVALMLFAVGRGYESVYWFDKKIRDEFSHLPEGFCFELCVHPNGPSAYLFLDAKKRLRYLATRSAKADVQMKFKNIERAFSVFTFTIGAYQSFAQNGLAVNGDLPSTIAFMRTLSIVESYLLPNFITGNILKEKIRFPFFKKTLGRICAYLHVITGVLTLSWLKKE